MFGNLKVIVGIKKGYGKQVSKTNNPALMKGRKEGKEGKRKFQHIIRYLNYNTREWIEISFRNYRQFAFGPSKKQTNKNGKGKKKKKKRLIENQ